jgi:3-hydroxybutyryl-CoA dehydratase
LATVIERSFHVSQETINLWAEISGDFNPLHVDPTYAATTKFGTTICHGHYSLSLMEALMLDILGPRWLHGGLLRDVKFRSPIRPGRKYVLRAIPQSQEAWTLELRDAENEQLAAQGDAIAPAS